MSEISVSINGNWYKLAHQGKNPAADDGPRMWSTSARPSLPTDPALPVQVTEWQTWGENLFSFEVIQPGQTTGFLGVDYGIDTESRWDGVNTLAPQVTTVSLTGTTGVGQNTNCWCLSGTMNASLFLYIGRGTGRSKITVSTMARATEASAALAENITGLLYTKSTNGTEEITEFMRTTAYRNTTTVANAGSNDTVSTNTGSEILTTAILYPDRIIGAQDATSAQLARVRSNIMTGAVTMHAPSWVTQGTLHNNIGTLKINSLGVDGNFVCVGSNGGIWTVDPAFNQFRPIAPEMAWDDNNCFQMANQQWLGLVYGTKYATRFIHWGEGTSIGPEMFRANTSPVRGRVTGVTGSDRWLYVALYDDVSGDTYILAGRPREATTDPSPNAIAWHTLRKFASKNVNFLGFPDTYNGTRTLPQLIGGYGLDFFYMECGRTTRWIDDTSLQYAVTGNTYLTQSRQQPGLIKDVEAVEFETAGCSSNQTVTVNLSFDDGSYQGFTTVTTNGYQRQLAVSGGVPLARTTMTGRRIKPRIDYTTNAVALAPSVVGKLRVHWRGRPVMTKTYDFGILITRDFRGQSVRDTEAQLVTEWGNSPVLVEDIEGNSYYVRIESVQVSEIAYTATEAGISQGAVRLAKVHATRWPTASGE